FLSEFTPSNFDADQQEVDPVSEADVYLAYGRYQQAEDLVRQAIIDQPDSDECKLKLLEIFHANENKAAFEEFATELVNAGRHNDLEFWSKVVVMGGEIAPDSSLFTDQGDIKTDLNAEELREDKGVVSDFVFDLSVFDTENAVEAEIAEGLESELDISSNSAETFSHANAAEAFDMSVSDLTDMDELETKIDLAKAYVEMGDEEAAREIADEVIAKGTERQKAIAQAIIDQLK
ncbi:MAG: FimV/HubP family polar landmark protein, partial [Methylococcales bacterium]